MIKKVLLLFVVLATISIGVAAQGIATDKYAENAESVVLYTDGFNSIHDKYYHKTADETKVIISIHFHKTSMEIFVFSPQKAKIIDGTFYIDNVRNSYSFDIEGKGINKVNNEEIKFSLCSSDHSFKLSFMSIERTTKKDTQSPLNLFYLDNYKNSKDVEFYEDIHNYRHGSLKQLRKAFTKKYKHLK